MAKWIWVLWGAEGQPAKELGDALRGALGAELGAARVVVDVIDGPPSPIERPREDGSRLAALVSVTGDAQPERARLAEHAVHVAGYRVEESVPRDYERSWPDGAASPGIKQVSLFRKRPELSDAAFREHWFGTHTPLALEVHPLWRYERNIVREQTEGAPPFDAIVGLHFREVEDVTDMQRFYGGEIANMKRIADDVRQFLDMKTIQIAHATEHVLTGGAA